MDGTEETCGRKRHGRVIIFEHAAWIFVFSLLVQSHIAAAVTRPREFLDSRPEAIGLRYCDFSASERLYNITDLLMCMDELASTAAAHSRVGRSSEDRDYFVPSSRRDQASASYNYPRRQPSDYQSYYDRRPTRFYSGPATYQPSQSGYYDRGYRYPTEQPYGYPGGIGTGLFDALASISQYDDLKCVSRILCEVATGVAPGNSDYRQNYDGGTSLISLLTALDIGEPFPLLTFGKSALTGYTNRGNPDICYREYPNCPRSNAELVNYLNNHNGGFFRFFANVGAPQGNYYRGAPKREPAPSVVISGPESDRTGTGELKFDSASALSRGYVNNFFPERREINDSDKVTFPQEPLQGAQSLNRVSKSLMGYQDPESAYQSPSFFPQDSKEPEPNMLYQPDNRPRLSRTMGSRKAKLYLPDEPINETISTFTFPDGQKVPVNVGFTKLFSENYKKALRRSFANDHEPEPTNFEGFSMINLVELYSNDRSRLDLQIVHPCDMICHDSKGTPVQFTQLLLHSGSLSTLMSPDQPILDLSNAVPCEVMCIDRRGERRQISTTLNQVLRTGYERQPALDMMPFQDDWQNRNYRSLNQRERSTDWKSRQIRETVRDSQRRHHRRHKNTRKEESNNESRRIRQSENKRNIANADEKSASSPQGSVLFGNGPMSFLGASIPLMGVGGFPQTPTFFPQDPTGQLGLAIQSMPVPMQPNNGMIQSLGMMPLFPGIIPIMDPMGGSSLPTAPVSPSSIICTDPGCLAGQQSPQRVLLLCGGILYFIPFPFLLPFCAIHLENGNATTPNSGGTGSYVPDERLPTTSSSIHSDNQYTIDNRYSTVPNKPAFTAFSSSTRQFSEATTHKYRPPEGKDYPQESCLEGESWNTDTHECVPIKYDPDIELDYMHLPGSPWSGVTRKPGHSRRLKKKKKKLVIFTDKGNITYIKAA